MSLDPSGRLVVLHISDTHYDVAWSPKNYMCDATIKRAVDASGATAVLSSGDLIPHGVACERDGVLGGDALSILSKSQARVSSLMSKMGTPWAYAPGNHDHECDDTCPEAQAMRQLSVIDTECFMRGASLPDGWVMDEDTFTTYAVPIYKGEGSEEIVGAALMIDNGIEPAEGLNDWIVSVGASLPDTAFTLAMMHKPPREIGRFIGLSGLYGEGNSPCGYEGIPEALATLPHFIGVFTGHDHGNTYCATDPVTGIAFCYCQKTGKAGRAAPNADSGSRVIDIQYDTASDSLVYAHTWTRTNFSESAGRCLYGTSATCPIGARCATFIPWGYFTVAAVGYGVPSLLLLGSLGILGYLSCTTCRNKRKQRKQSVTPSPDVASDLTPSAKGTKGTKGTRPHMAGVKRAGKAHAYERMHPRDGVPETMA
ncbi:hypothetical protein KIPB_007287 [Kipferlia bialata]|uniref:Calcineurin-like phosphoesterase domain-containing protein n=1 Tax=Kipferlia bialata TaxID=797122 RepID=A0A9K3CYA6_9EUKA|nr:hypothetical protein KIPB_007287 [Kipferlia bialata]|eukprot:g7287.t1